MKKDSLKNLTQSGHIGGKRESREPGITYLASVRKPLAEEDAEDNKKYIWSYEGMEIHDSPRPEGTWHTEEDQ